MIYAGVIVDISHEKLDKIFQYSVPEDIASVISIGNKSISRLVQATERDML